MSLHTDIEDIRSGLKAGRYKNEAAVSQGIILRLLNTTGWSIFDSSQVIPEFSVGAGRVDYALCHPPGKPIILIESKAIGDAQGAERQLFEYAFHQGIPMAILTDGQEWSFFLPGEQGAYRERCVYKLDLSVRSTEECCRIFERYLKHSEVISGAAFANARDDYKNVSKKRQIETTLPQAWMQLLKEQDEILVELIADEVESLCGFKPEPDTVRRFLDAVPRPLPMLPSAAGTIQPPKPSTPVVPTANGDDDDFSGFIYRSQQYREGTAIATMFKVFEVLSQGDAAFFDRYASLLKHGRNRKRRFLAQNKMDLYPGRPDLCQQYSQQRFGGWWIGTNYSRSAIRRAIELACEVAGVRYGTDLRLISQRTNRWSQRATKRSSTHRQHRDNGQSRQDMLY